MGPRPVIFISAVSQELRGARDLVAKSLLSIGYESKWQDIAPTETGDLHGVLRKWVDDSAAVIQLVGQRYGFGPPEPDALFGQVSYTQFETLYARQRGKKVWYILLAPEHPTEVVTTPEPPALHDLQAAYRQRITGDGHLYHPSASLDRTQLIVLQLRDDLARLRRGWKQWAALVLALLVLCAGLGVWMVKSQTRMEQVVTNPVVLRAKLEEKIDASFEQKRRELLAAKALPTEVDALYRWRDRAKEQVAEGVAFMAARAADPKSPLIGQASGILEERGVDAALKFLDDKLKEQRQRRKEEGRQLAEASMMKADLHGTRLETDERELAIREAIPEAPDWWVPHNAMGLILKQRAEWQLAELEYDAARKFMDTGGEATVLLNLASLYRVTDRLEKAERLLERAVEITKKRFGPEHPEVATALGQMAQLYHDTRRFKEAEPLMTQVLEINEKRFGPDDPQVATALNNLAQLYHDTDRLKEAEPLMKRVLAIDQKSFGLEHTRVALALDNLASLYADTERPALAEPLMKQALTIYEKSYGPDHPEVATCVNNLAQLYLNTDRRDQAELLMERALKIDEKSFGPDHPSVARDLSNLSALYWATDRIEKAETCIRRSVLIVLKSTRAAGHMIGEPDVKLNNYRSVLRGMKLPEAEVAQRLTAAAREAGYTPEEFSRLLKELE